ncbi:MAG: glucose-1-phosphate cytidylyltransferase [Candidatus Firestonebacteria bacterium]|nr:glucose-1-phosphate cytidylyltransferase [Candidatus Firestonebacteria bacterium]
MDIVILCGGLGTRLREETEFRPKPMVNIGNRPILWHIMKLYGKYGYNNFILGLGYKGEMIKDYFYHYELMNTAVTVKLGHPRELTVHQCHDESGWNITMVDTGEHALKGARLKRLAKFVKSNRFMLTYGDGISNIDINDLLKFHNSHGKIATVTGINPTSRFGELKIIGDKVESFCEKPQNSSGLINGGFFVFEKEIFNYLDDNDNCDLEIGALEKIAQDGQLMVYKHKGFWACMDTIRDVEYLNRIWNENKASWKIW